MLRRRRAITNDNGHQSAGMRHFLETGDSSRVTGDDAHEVLRIRRERRKSQPVVDQHADEEE